MLQALPANAMNGFAPFFPQSAARSLLYDLVECWQQKGDQDDDEEDASND